MYRRHEVADHPACSQREFAISREDIINDPEYGNKAAAFEAFGDIPTNPNLCATIGDVIAARYGRRDILLQGDPITADGPGATPMDRPEDAEPRWPDFDPAMPPRPSVVVVTKIGGGKIAV